MKIRLLSDLHAEFYHKRGGFNTDLLNTRGEDVLVLAGDVGVGVTQVVDTFGSFLQHGAKQIVYVTGNHEYYRSKVTEFDYELELELAAYYPEVCWLRDGQTSTIQGVDFMGGTLWTNFHEDPVAEKVSNAMIVDFKIINGFSTKLAKHLYYTTVEGLKRSVREAGDNKKVVVTHFLPCDQCTHPKYISGGYDPVNWYFANDLHEFISDLDNAVWLFGHTHEPMQLRVGNTNLYSNPLGYPGEKQTGKFNQDLLITV